MLIEIKIQIGHNSIFISLRLTLKVLIYLIKWPLFNLNLAEMYFLTLITCNSIVWNQFGIPNKIWEFSKYLNSIIRSLLYHGSFFLTNSLLIKVWETLKGYPPPETILYFSWFHFELEMNFENLLESENGFENFL